MGGRYTERVRQTERRDKSKKKNCNREIKKVLTKRNEAEKEKK